MPLIDVGGRRLHYARRGSGSPLLLNMGMSGSHLHWGDPFLEELEREFDVIAYDNRGIGESDPVSDAFTIEDLAGDALGLLDALEVPNAHVLGISMGGMTAQALALRAPERVRTLTIGCSYCGGPGAVMAPPETVAKLSEGLLSGDREQALRTGFECNVSPGFQTEEHFAAFREVGMQSPAALPVIMLQMQAIAAFDVSARLPTIDRPTLVIHGDVDMMLPFPNGELIASLIPGARLERLVDVGHMFWWEEPVRSAALIVGHSQR